MYRAAVLPVNRSSSAHQDVHLGRALVKAICNANGMLHVDEKSWRNFYRSQFGREPSGQMRDYFYRFPNIFSCEPDHRMKGTMIIRSKAALELCDEHCSSNGCHMLGCEGLHCCKFFLCGTCKFKEKCKYGHDLTESHNRKLLAKYFLDDLSAKELGVFMRSAHSKQTFPKTCKFYNNEGGCRKGDRGEKCPHMHVCRHYILDDCTFGKRCKRSHNIYDAQPKRILAKYGVRIDRSPKEVLAELREVMQTETESEPRDGANGEFSASSDSDDSYDGLGAVGPAPTRSRSRTSSSSSATRDSTEICTFFLWTKCNYGKSCANKHPKSQFPYQWQYEVDGEWKDFEKDPNNEIEVLFCDPNKDDCFVKDSSFERVVGIDFDAMKCMQIDRDVRRLSTKSSLGLSSKHLFLTEWCWYWKDKKTNGWIEFGKHEDLTSEDLEEEFSLNPNSHVPFLSDRRVDLVADLQKMKRINQRSGSVTDIRRRPLLFDPKTKQPCRQRECRSPAVRRDLSGLNLGTTYPETWNLEFRSDNDFFQIVPVAPGSKEFLDIERLFKASMPNIPLKSVKRIQNAELWDGFYRKKTWMSKKLTQGETLNVRHLFHGTKDLYVDAICQQGFDWRMCGFSVGTAYGKGSYFARDAAYSAKYADCRKMFVVRVLVGEYAKGNKSMVRPPPKDARHPFGELYDSVVNALEDPHIFVVFTQEQAYPEYLIEY